MLLPGSSGRKRRAQSGALVFLLLFTSHRPRMRPSPLCVPQQLCCACPEYTVDSANQAEKRAERLTVSALSALSNLLEAVGDEANSELCTPSADGATGCDGDAAQSHQVMRWRIEQVLFSRACFLWDYIHRDSTEWNRAKHVRRVVPGS